MFWKTYSKFIYSEFSRLITISIKDLNYGFIKGIFCIEKDLYIYIYIYIRFDLTFIYYISICEII